MRELRGHEWVLIGGCLNPSRDREGAVVPIRDSNGAATLDPNQSHDREGVGHLAGAINQSASRAPLPGSARTRDYPAPLFTADAPTCPDCGSLMTRNGSCYKCENCGATSGCS